MFASAASASPFTVTLDDFRVQYRPDASPESFAADVRWQSMTGRDGQRERRQTLQVNHPLSIAGARVYLLDHGFAVDLEVRGRDGAVLRREAVQLSQFGPNFISRGVLKVPFTGTFEGKPLPQLGFDVVFYPTIGTTSDRRLYSRTPDAQIPALVYTTYAGDLGLAAGPQNVNDLDLTNLVQAGEPATLFPGQTSAALPGGATLHFVGVKEYAVLQVTRDPGKLAVLISAVLALVGLLLSLRVRRRRIWVRAEPGEGGTVVTVGGLARSDSDALRREVSRVVDRLGGPAPPDPITQED
jgi:cytochrome c biogenesis protein